MNSWRQSHKMQRRNHLDSKSTFWLKGAPRTEGWLSHLALILIRPLDILKRKCFPSPYSAILKTYILSLNITQILGDNLPCIERGWTEGHMTRLFSLMVYSKSLAGMAITYVLNVYYVGQPHNRQGSPVPSRALSPQLSTSARPAQSSLPELHHID